MLLSLFAPNSWCMHATNSACELPYFNICWRKHTSSTASQQRKNPKPHFWWWEYTQWRLCESLFTTQTQGKLKEHWGGHTITMSTIHQLCPTLLALHQSCGKHVTDALYSCTRSCREHLRRSRRWLQPHHVSEVVGEVIPLLESSCALLMYRFRSFVWGQTRLYFKCL